MKGLLSKRILPLLGLWTTFFLFQGTNNFAQANSCSQVKNCFSSFSVEGGNLTQNWNQVLLKMTAKLAELENKERYILVEHPQIWGRNQVTEMQKQLAQLKGYQTEYQKLLEWCLEELKNQGHHETYDKYLQIRTNEISQIDQKKMQEIAEKENEKHLPSKAGKVFGKKITPFHKRSVSTVDQETLDYIFSYIKNQEYIPFQYPDDGCYARAHEMNRVFKDKMELKLGKAFLVESRRTKLKVKTPNHPSGEVSWVYHVAPYIYLLSENGYKKKMILDPSIFDRAVTATEWAEIQSNGRFDRTDIKFTDNEIFFPADLRLRSRTVASFEESNNLLTDLCLRTNKYLETDRLKELEKKKLKVK